MGGAGTCSNLLAQGAPEQRLNSQRRPPKSLSSPGALGFSATGFEAAGFVLGLAMGPAFLGGIGAAETLRTDSGETAGAGAGATTGGSAGATGGGSGGLTAADGAPTGTAKAGVALLPSRIA